MLRQRKERLSFFVWPMTLTSLTKCTMNSGTTLEGAMHLRLHLCLSKPVERFMIFWGFAKNGFRHLQKV